MAVWLGSVRARNEGQEVLLGPCRPAKSYHTSKNYTKSLMAKRQYYSHVSCGGGMWVLDSFISQD